MCAQYIKQGNIFGRIGTGIGKGLGEQIPKEIQRERMGAGLRDLEQESANLDPLQFFTRAQSIPGVSENPQLIHSLGELAKQKSRGEALIRENQKKTESPFPIPKTKASPELPGENKAPSITTRTPIEATLNPYIPKTLTELNQRAGELFQENPRLYANDPQKALEAASIEDKQNQNINTAMQGQRVNEQNVQNTVKTALQDQNTRLGAVVPGNIYSDIEDKAINSVRSQAEGGEGFTEQQAQKKYGKELDEISRQYKAIESIGNWSLLTRSPSGNREALKAIRHDFKKRNDLENLADSYIAKNGLSPSKAYYLAYPTSDYKELNNAINKLPELRPETSIRKGYLETAYNPENQYEIETRKAIEKIGPLLGDGSPQAVAEEFMAKGYDPSIVMDYFTKNRDKLNLTERQGRELGKPRNFTASMNDLWMFLFSGLDKLVEQ